MPTTPTPTGDAYALVGRPRAGRALGALALGGFTIGTTEFATMGLLPQIGANLGVSDPVAGHAITAYALGVVIGAPLLTLLAARLDRRRLLMFLMAGYAVANVVSAAAPSIGWLVAGRFLAGLPHGAFFGVGAVAGTAVVGAARRGRAVATMMAGLTVANIIGVPVSTALGQQLGWRAAFLLIGVLGALTLVALSVGLPRDLPRGSGSPRRELAALRSVRLWLAFAAAAVGFGGMFAVYSYIAPTMTRVSGAPERLVPVVLAVFGIGMTLGTVVSGRLVDRSVRRTLLLGFPLTLASLIAFGLLAPWLWPAVAAFFAMAVTSQLVAIGLQALLMDLAPAAPSLGAALCHSALNVANANGAFVGGLVIAAGWGYQAPAAAGAVLTVLGIGVLGALALVARRPR